MALLAKYVLILFLADSLILQSTESARIAHSIAVSKAGKDNETCLENFAQPCKTLSFVLERLQNSTLVEIRNGIYYLDKAFNLTNKKDVAFIGESNEVEIQCNRSAEECGLSFHRCEGVQFANLTLDGFRHLQSTRPFDDHGVVYHFYAGISFTFCKNIQVDGCTLKNSRGIAMVLYDTGGIVKVIGSRFINNTGKRDLNLQDGKFIKSGGGVLLHLTGFYDNSNYTFQASTFQKNRFMEKLNNSSAEVPSPFGCGAGLSAYICGSAQNNSLIIDSCNFTSNKAIFGGGVFLEFHNEAEGNSLFFKNNTFLKNTAIYGGGAVRTGNDIIENNTTVLKENGIKYVGNRFYKNKALLGGGLSHFGWTYHQVSADDDRKITLEDCHFVGNVATMGSAIAIALNNKNRWKGMGKEVPYALEVINSSIRDNTADYAKENVVGMGSVYSAQVPCILKGNNTFYNNSNTALLMDNAHLKVFDNTLFKKNKGYKGGALAMYGQSRLVVTKNSRLIFQCNEAMERGGAMYIRTPGPDVVAFSTTKLRRHECVIVYEENGNLVTIDRIGEWNATLDFINNSAPYLYGNSVYATTLQSCFREHEQSRDNTAFDWKGVISYSGTTEEEISTDPVAIELNAMEWASLAPDEKFSASIRLVDEKNNAVAGVVKIKVSSKSRRLQSSTKALPSLFPDSSLFLVQTITKGNKTRSFVSDLRIKGVEGDNFTVEISTGSGQVVSTRLDVMKLSRCLAGFHQTPSLAKITGKCVCMNDTQAFHEGVSKCLDDGRTVYLKTGYWGGRVNNNGPFVTYPCRPGYCNVNGSQFDFVYHKSTMCDNNRDSNSNLCGSCPKNFSLALGSEKCIDDKRCNDRLYAVYWGIPVFLVAVPPLVVVLLCLNVDIFTSYLSAWLYFYQALPFVVNDQEQLLDDGMQVIIDFTSWRVPGTHLSCFFKGLDNIDKMLFNYLFPLYVLIVLLLISWFARCACCFRVFTKCCRFLQHVNVYHAISTILVLCYTELTLISFHVCRWVRLGNNTDVLVIQGNIYNSTDGSKYVPITYYVCLVIAILVILCFVIVLPLALIFRSPLVRKINFFANFNGLFDVFQNCFRDDYRWFSAYYFLCRIALLLLTAVLSTPGPKKRCLIEILTLLSLVILAFSKPYQNHENSNLRWLNMVDTVILTILCIITLMSSARNSEASVETRKSMKFGIRFLSWLPMVYLLVLIVLALRHYCGTYVHRNGYENLDDPSQTGTSSQKDSDA